MPIIANAKKALRQTKTRTIRNRVARAQVRTVVRKSMTKPTESILSSLFSTLDRAVKRHLIHKNKAARLKAHAVKQMTTNARVAEKLVKTKTTSTKKKVVAKKPTAKKASKVVSKK